MEDATSTPTLTVQGYTPYAQVPRWVLRSGGRLSSGAVHLYGVIMSYADNDTRAAFPGQETLSRDLGVSVRSIFTYMKALEDFGALRVERRRNRRTGNFYANHYVLVFIDPSEADFRRPSEAGDRRSRPTEVPTLTSSSTPDLRSSDHGSTPELRSGASEPGNISGTDRAALRSILRRIGRARAEGHSWNDDAVRDLWDAFTSGMEEAVGTDTYQTYYEDLLVNGKWTVSAAAADPYAAGIELNKIINTALTT